MTRSRRWKQVGLVLLVPLLVCLLLVRENVFSPGEWRVVKEKYRLFEESLERSRPEPERLARASAALERREGLFFHGKFRKTLEAIGEAWAIVEGRGWDRSARSLWSWHLTPPVRLLPREEGPPRQARLSRAISLGTEDPHRFHLKIIGWKGRVDVDRPLETPGDRIGGAGVGIPIPPDLREGSYALEVEVQGDSAPLGTLRVRFSVAHDLEGRLAALTEAEEAARGKDDDGLRSAAESLRYAIDLLRKEARGEETGYRGDLLGLLRRLEMVAIALRREKDPYPSLPGDMPRSFDLGAGESIPCRVFLPKGAARGEPTPLLLALHGWNDDEHKFFEFNGGGILRRLAEEFGLLVVCPRRTGAGSQGESLLGLVETLMKVYPAIDSKRIYLLAHSWGARQGLDAVRRGPGRFAALSIFAGAATGKSLDGVEGLPVYLACGTRDEGRLPDCREVAARAEAKGYDPFTYREVEGVGHVEILWSQAEEAIRWMISEGKKR